LYDVLKIISLEKQNFGRGRIGQQKKILIEFVSANPTGPLSIAHARQAAVGDSLANILEFCDYAVKREYYINDEGNQIKQLGLSLRVRYLECLGQKDVEFPVDGYKGEYLYNIARELVDKEKDKYLLASKESVQETFSNYATAKILEQIKNDLDRFGVKFDSWFSQKSLSASNAIGQGLKLLQEKEFLCEQDGAVWFKSTQFGDDKDRVLIKSDKQYTYLAPDIAYHNLKFKRGFDKLINIWGPDHHGYINRLKAAVAALGYCKDDLFIIIIQLATLLRAGEPIAMSTRAGEYITLSQLIDEIGKDAARFFLLMRRCDSHLEFDLELAKKQSLENPVYYIQYAHARISSILQFKSEQAKPFDTKMVEFSLLKEAEILELIRKLNRFPDVIRDCAMTLDPHGLTVYLRELAGQFHFFYNKYRVISEDKAVSSARLVLVECVQQVIVTGLRLLGVDTPHKM